MAALVGPVGEIAGGGAEGAHASTAVEKAANRSLEGIV
jgi:hypothetical protein